MTDASSLIILVAVLVGFWLGRMSRARLRAARPELVHRPDPVTQLDLSLECDDADGEAASAWLESVVMPAPTTIHHPEDVVLRAAGFVIWSRPARGEPLWQDRTVRCRDTYPQSVALLIARDRLTVKTGKG